MNEEPTGAETHDADHGHVMPVWLLGAVLGALLVLTALTVTASQMELGDLDIAVAIGIAVVKSALVCLFFMHLLYDRLFNTAVFLCALMFVILFIGFVLMDTFQYQPDIKALQDLNAAQQAP